MSRKSNHHIGLATMAKALQDTMQGNTMILQELVAEIHKAPGTMRKYLYELRDLGVIEQVGERTVHGGVTPVWRFVKMVEFPEPPEVIPEPVIVTPFRDALVAALFGDANIAQQDAA